MSTGVAIIGFILWFVAGISFGKMLGTQERIKLLRLRKSVPGAVQTVEVLSAYVIYRASNGCQLPYAKTDEIGLYGDEYPDEGVLFGVIKEWERSIRAEQRRSEGRMAESTETKNA